MARKARPRDDERLYTGEPVETADGSVDVPAQQNVGRQAERGEGEWPHPGTPPQAPTAKEPYPEERTRDR